jgi:catechol 2,3-dioxygenase-like lactoylglutathione lyase family enzyme
MLERSALIGFVGVSHLDRARRFYGETLGLPITEESQLTARGVHFTRYDGMGQDERGVWAAPGGAKIAWFLDPDGNNLSLTEFQASQ